MAIVGPTGSGKSALALRLARELHAEVVNYDSVQLYRGLDIGSAKTPIAERLDVPHHLLDCIEPIEELTAGAYAQLARCVLREIAARQKLPILVGGTGFYLRSLLDGLSDAPGRDSALRTRLADLAARRPAALHRFLKRNDPASANRIHPNDLQKLIRAIEIAHFQPQGGTGLGPREPLTGFRGLKIGLAPPRTALYESINGRTEEMFARGLLDETRTLLERGIPPGAKALQTLGYRQAVAVIEQRMSVAEAIAVVQLKTRQYAKRQITWFRREPGVRWVESFGNTDASFQAALRLIREFMRGA